MYMPGLWHNEVLGQDIDTEDSVAVSCMESLLCDSPGYLCYCYSSYSVKCSAKQRGDNKSLNKCLLIPLVL